MFRISCLLLVLMSGHSVLGSKPLNTADFQKLKCKTTSPSGGLIKTLTFELQAGSATVQAESFAGGGLRPVTVLKTISTPVSIKYVLDQSSGHMTSLVVQGQKAAMLYESENTTNPSHVGATIEFLDCH